MRLKKLTICGFKSFAEKVVLDFDCEIVGIVGPNGCGKSNIVDAFRWVMGEQSAKSLRGDKMHDVLFAGTDHRKPLNYAEVSVWLTDINGELPLPYSEITITRRLHRNGESEYFINKELTRLKDIQALFLGTGIGKNAFSIFEQGKLDQLIHLSPLERRAIFDEAAGTSRFLQRKKETVRKLESVSENHTRVHDIHAEIEQQLRQLKKQAIHAKSYQENKALLEELERKVLIFRRQNLVKQVEGLQCRHQLFEQEITAHQREVDHSEKAFEKVKQRVLAEEMVAKQALKELNNCETKTRVLEVAITQQKHRLLEFKKRQDDVQHHIEKLKIETEQYQNELVQRALCVQKAGEEQERLLNDLAQKKELYAELDMELNNLREEVKQAQTKHVSLLRQEGQLNNQLHEKTFRYEACLTRLQILTALENTHESTCHAINQQIDLQRMKVSELSAQIDGDKAALKLAESELHTLRTTYSQMELDGQALARKITEEKSHHRALMGLQEDMEGFSFAAKMLLQETKNPKSPLYGKIIPLFEYLLAKEGHEEVLASAMRPYMETLVVSSEEDLQQLLDFASQKQLSDFSVIVKNHCQQEDHPKMGSLAEYCLQNPVSYHFTKHFTLTENKNFYDSLGVYFQVGTGKKWNNPFQRHAELTSLSENIAVLQQKWERYQANQSNLNKQLQQVEKARTERSEIYRKKEMDLIQENFKLQQSLGDAEKLKREIASVGKEKAELAKIHGEEKAITLLKENLQSIKQEMAHLLAALQKNETLLLSRQDCFKDHAQALRTAEGLFHEGKANWLLATQELQILKVKQEQNGALQVKLQKDIEQMKAQVESIFQSLSQQESELDRSQKLLMDLQTTVSQHDHQLEETKKLEKETEKEWLQKRKTLSSIEKEFHELTLSLSQEKALLQGVDAELLERYGAVVNHDTQPVEINLENVLEEIKRLRLALEGSGAVNMTAIEEFQKTQERFDYLDQHLKDLEEAKKDLEGMIKTLDQESRKLFKQTFQKIRENFQKNFAILFTGGSADLTFTESVDILEAGIEIVAKPPGKQMRAISLLSGGEKCLTALALLFSIFEVCPAPFCILDEVDAPLDDTNIDRFTTVLKQYIKKTQFIIVTHNKKTMSKADLLIGVSMEEKGVSKLLSLALKESTIRSNS
jgi:chromosome segregation protein